MQRHYGAPGCTAVSASVQRLLLSTLTPRDRNARRPRLATFLVLVAAGLVGCGDDPARTAPTQPQPPAATWSEILERHGGRELPDTPRLSGVVREGDFVRFAVRLPKAATERAALPVPSLGVTAYEGGAAGWRRVDVAIPSVDRVELIEPGRSSRGVVRLRRGTGPDVRLVLDYGGAAWTSVR